MEYKSWVYLVIRRIGINARPLTDPRMRGFARYIVNLLQAMHKIHPDAEFYLYANRPVAPGHKEALPFAHWREELVRPKLCWQRYALRRGIQKDRFCL